MIYSIVLSIHSFLRWLVVLAGLAVVVKAVVGWLGKQPYTQQDTRLMWIFVGVLNAQFLVGLLLYFFFSPLTHAALLDFSLVAQNGALGFFAIGHPLLMVIATALANIGRARVPQAPMDKGKYRRAVIFFGVAMLLILLAIPWPFFSYGRPLNPFRMFGG